jgi:hypothetical protein
MINGNRMRCLFGGEGNGGGVNGGFGSCGCVHACEMLAMQCVRVWGAGGGIGRGDNEIYTLGRNSSWVLCVSLG